MKWLYVSTLFSFAKWRFGQRVLSTFPYAVMLWQFLSVAGSRHRGLSYSVPIPKFGSTFQDFVDARENPVHSLHGKSLQRWGWSVFAFNKPRCSYRNWKHGFGTRRSQRIHGLIPVRMNMVYWLLSSHVRCISVCNRRPIPRNQSSTLAIWVSAYAMDIKLCPAALMLVLNHCDGMSLNLVSRAG